MDTVTKYVIPILSLLVGIGGAVLGAGPLGAILAGVGTLGLLAGGIFLYNKLKGIQFDNAHNAGNEQAVDDHGHVIENNQHQGHDDEVSEAQSAADKIEAEHALEAEGAPQDGPEKHTIH